jgi:hypothetical protein
MIFYEVLGTIAAPCQLVGTQVDAKALAKERGTSWEQTDVPTDKAGLMAYVNRLKADVSAEMHREPYTYAPTTSLPPVDTRPVTAEQAELRSMTMTTNDIVEFLWDKAQPNQAADIIEALLRKMKEVSREVR